MLLFVNIQLLFLVDGPVTQQQEWLLPKRQVQTCMQGVKYDFQSVLHSLRTPMSNAIMDAKLFYASLFLILLDETKTSDIRKNLA